MSPTSTTPRLIIHGGAGHITRENLPPDAYNKYASALKTIHRSTSELLNKGATALDAATFAVALFEDCPLFNCGKGAVMVSRGYRKRACGVVLVKRVKNPIKLAREMLVRGETDGSGGGNGGGGDPSGGAGGAQGHCCLGGETVEKLAEEWGLDMVDESYFWTKKRWDEHRRGLNGNTAIDEARTPVFDESKTGWDGKEYLPQGTVGCVALDRYGTLCVATSTGGLTNKLPCRIGDTPTIGAGFWAEEWDESFHEEEIVPSSSEALSTDLLKSLRSMVGDCLPNCSNGLENLHSSTTAVKERKPLRNMRSVALSGTGNGDSFLRLAAARTAGAIVRFAPSRSLASAVSQIAGPLGELQRSAGNRWGKTGEGEGGIIGIELVNGKGKLVFDFNCGGMFRCWIDDMGRERVMVFKDEY
ncbi:hypothetical protein ACLMJK_007922 [Lecanora helva]